MNAMFQLRLKFPWWLWLAGLAFLVGALHLAPSLFIKAAIERIGGLYLLPQVVHPTHSDSVMWYVPASREVAEGHLVPSDIYIPTNKRLPFFLPPLPLIFFGALIALAGDANYAYLAALFVFPVITFFLFYWLGRLFLASRLGSAAFALVGTLTPVALAYLGRTTETLQLTPLITLKSFLPFVRTPIPELYLSRITEPLLTIPLLILGFGFLWRFWIQPSPRRGALAGGAMALTLYTYLHYFAFLAGFGAVLFCFSFAVSRERANLRVWAIFFGAMAIGILPFLFNYLELRALPQFGDWAARLSGAFERWRGIRLSAWRDYILYAILAIPLIPLWRRDRRLAMFFGAALVAMVMLWNIQIVTGFSIIPTHWHKAFGVPLYTLVAVELAYAAASISQHPRWRVRRRAIAAGLTVLLVFLVAKRIMNAAAYLYPDRRTMAAFSFPAEIYDSWQWLNQNVPSESVVLSTSYVTSLYLAGYTDTNHYLPFGDLTLTSRRDLEERFLTAHKLFGVPEERVRLLLRGKYYPPTICDVGGECGNEHSERNLLRVPQMLYNGAFDPRQHGQDQLELSYEPLIPLAVIDDLMGRYENARPDWKDFRGDYVYYGPWEREIHSVNLKTNPRLELLYNRGGVEIYKVR